ncbi:TetR/AcrR family transcriptional regulator [Aneurinibacillus sp. REN35]|uniref:TetR/AcrR family transcriptional regulator n=1 Tax=Aneurinibacillus sp. REN35 TaxID=3237286 RepID=UPI003526F0EA
MAKPNVVSKKDLLESAKTRIVEYGLDKLTLKSVAEGAGVTQGTVYYHFRTKEQLLLEIVKDLCQSSWNQIADTPTSHTQKVKAALTGAKERCTSESFYHRLFFSLLAYSFQNAQTKEQLHELLHFENDSLSKQLTSLWSASPVEGVSLETWGILLNALIDGLAVQALLSDSFPTEKIYNELEILLTH